MLFISIIINKIQCYCWSFILISVTQIKSKHFPDGKNENDTRLLHDRRYHLGWTYHQFFYYYRYMEFTMIFNLLVFLIRFCLFNTWLSNNNLTHMTPVCHMTILGKCHHFYINIVEKSNNIVTLIDMRV